MKKGGKGGGVGDREEETTSQAANMGKASTESSGLQHGGVFDGGLDMDPRVELHFQALILQESPPSQHSSLLPMTFLFLCQEVQATSTYSEGCSEPPHPTKG